MAPSLPAPHERAFTVGRAELEAGLRATLAEGALSHGWLIAGPAGSGKATLAYRLARAILDPAALSADGGLDVDPTSRVFRLVASRAHPDLFVAERLYDEKKAAYRTEITVDTIRNLSSFLSKTAGFGGWRVAIVDRADEMNQAASNALLKSLEEPPPRTTLLLLANAPGRLLPTIRSRCRRIDLRPMPDEDVRRLLEAESGLEEGAIADITRAARGRPGHALTLAAGEGAEAVAAVGSFLAGAIRRGDPGAAAASLTGRAAGERWPIFKELLLERLSAAARSSACGLSEEGDPLGAMAPDALVEAHEKLAGLLGRGDALNVDRRELLYAMARSLRECARPRAA